MSKLETYIFRLYTNTGMYEVHPVYSDKLAIKYKRESNEAYIRAELSSSLKFVGEDYEIIANSDIESEFNILVLSVDVLGEPSIFLACHFTKTDCEIDEFSRLVEVKPTIIDEYEAFTAALDKKVDLIKLAPEIEPVLAYKRPALQLYIPGEKVIGTFLEGLYFEQECEAISDLTELNSVYGFSPAAHNVDIYLIQEPGSSTYIKGKYYISGSWLGVEWTSSDGARMVYRVFNGEIAGKYTRQMLKNDSVIYEAHLYTFDHPCLFKEEFHTVNGYKLSYNLGRKFVNRVLHDNDSYSGPKASIKGTTAFGENHNYRYATPLDWDSFELRIISNIEVSSEPTQFGLRQPGEYYKKPIYPASHGLGLLFPITKSAWGYASFWFASSIMQSIIDKRFRKQYTIKHTYPLHSCISKIMSALGLNIAFKASTAYSKFLYDTYNPISFDRFRLNITPITNILKGEYDNPAQKCEITLKQILDMLKTVFKCYWFLDNGKLRIEHISYFTNGLDYDTQQIGIDTLSAKCAIVDKSWSFGANKYSYIKKELPERYQFKWADDCTEPFEGFPIEAKSIYVKKGQIEEINVTGFSSDIDYMLLNPGSFNNDNIAILAVDTTGSIPYVRYSIRNEFGEMVDYVIQNGFLSFIDIALKYYKFELPCSNIIINKLNIKDVTEIYTVKRTKKQTEKYPYAIKNAHDLSLLYKLVKSEIGVGQLDSAEFNLSSGMLKMEVLYDTK